VDALGPAAYGDAFADVYDDWYADVSDTDGTVDLVARLAAGGSVLELGVGTGRIALRLAARGVPVHGIDASQRMLDRLRAKPGADSVTVSLGDFADVAVDGQFAVVLATYNTFFSLPTEADQRRCLGNTAGRLRPGGVVVIEGFLPDPDAPAAHVAPKIVEADRVVLHVTTLDHEAQTLRGQHITLSAAGMEIRPSFLRWATPPQLDEMAAAAGLALQDRWGGWRRERFGPDSARHVSIYRRAG